MESHSVKVGINDHCLERDSESFIEKFEVEEREIFSNADEIVSNIGDMNSKRIADVGAGTGVFMERFAKKVGEKGKVYCLEISPKFIEFLNNRRKELKLNDDQVEIIQVSHTEIPLSDLDFIFLSDTYHHIEFPTPFLQSVKKALKPDGKLIIIDFNRIEGLSSDWHLEHVRAGKEVVYYEIQSQGFILEEEKMKDVLIENYFAIFKKK